MRFTLYRGADTIIPHNECIISRQAQSFLTMRFTHYIEISVQSQCRHNHSSRWDLHYIEVSVQTQSFLTMRFTLYRGLSADTIIPHDEIYMIIRGLSADTIIPHDEIYIIISRSQCRHNHSSRWDLYHYIEVSVQTQLFLTMRFICLYRGLSADTIIPHDEIYIIISRSQCRHNHSSRWDLYHYIEVSV